MDGRRRHPGRGRERDVRAVPSLKTVALTRNVLLPVGTDYTPPNKWVTEIHRDWNERYTWPRFVCGLPRDFFAAVRAELDERGIAPSPQTRDMNPIYTGKDVSYIDTKQANSDAETRCSTPSGSPSSPGCAGATYPQAALDKAWGQLVYGAHHDAITGSESDQVYLDLLTGWRDAWDLGRSARDNALDPDLQRRRRLGRGVEHGERTSDRCGDGAAGRAARRRRAGASTPTARAARSGRARRPVGHLAGARHPGAGLARLPLTPSVTAAGWDAVGGRDFPEIANERYRLRVDPARGGAVARR